MSDLDFTIAAPKPASLMQSLRAVGYSVSTAIADIVDNSITAGARNVAIDFYWAGDASRISIADDGHGMTTDQLNLAMTPGSQSPLEERDAFDLGRFGLGLKTASFSQCRELSVVSKTESTDLVARTWDLDYVTKENKWHLLNRPSHAAEALISDFSKQKSGTLVVWSRLDHIAPGGTMDEVAHRVFRDAIDNVKKHLAMTFHRYIEKRRLTLSVNTGVLEAWNPFPDAAQSPIEEIPFHAGAVTFQGFVLPHKDKLTPEEFDRLAGLKGWNGQQGFYVYRNERLLVCGTWLGLGRGGEWTLREEFRLARIRLDIGNSSDHQWQLDVKKATATPPALIRQRLTDLSEKIRNQARSVFVHRGRYGTRAAPQREFVRPWSPKELGGKTVYRINRDHPLVKAVLATLGDKEVPEVERLLRLLEETVPVQQIWLDASDPNRDTARPYVDVDTNVLRSDIRATFNFLVEAGINPETAREKVRNTEPFIDYPDIVRETCDAAVNK